MAVASRGSQVRTLSVPRDRSRLNIAVHRNSHIRPPFRC
jgi:hypothetical protein